jgi:site-specific recombinase XerC
MQMQKKYPACLSRFSQWLEDQNLQSTTKRVYISRLSVWLRKTCDESILTSLRCSTTANKLVLTHLAELEHQQARTTTIRCFLSAARTFYRFHGVQLERIKVAQDQLPERKCLEQNEVNKLILVTHNSPKERALISLIARAGLRMWEIIQLNMHQIEIVNPHLIRLNFSHRTSIMLDGTTSSDLLFWLVAVRPTLVTEEEAVFVNTNGTRLSASGVDYLLRNTGYKVGLEISARTLRNTYKTIPARALSQTADYMISTVTVSPDYSQPART